MAPDEQPKTMKRPQWLKEAQGEKETGGKPEAPAPTPASAAKEATVQAHTATMDRVRPDGAEAPSPPQTPPRGAGTKAQQAHTPPRTGSAGGGGPSSSSTTGEGALRGFLSCASRKARANPGAVVLIATITLVLLALILVLFAFGVLGSGGGEEPSNTAPSASSETTAGVRLTDLAFGELMQEEGGETVTLEGAGFSWQGEVQDGEAGQTVTLKGPTAVQIRQGFELPHSSVQSGVYAVAQDEGPVMHVVFNTFLSGETEVTQGSIFSIEDDALEESGYYRDEREKGTETVVRTYFPSGGENYRVSFEAPQGTPVPLLVGYRGVES